MNVFPPQSDHPLFRYLTPDERERVESFGELRQIPDGGELIRAGDTDSTLYAVEEGQLNIIADRDGQQAVIATVGTGDVLGEVSFIDGSPRTLSVVADRNATVRAWQNRTLTEALAADPQVMAKFAVAMCELLVERLRDTARRV